eukprot:TRINITY_DN23504_c0_g1_i1.p1 TRINITY_DN23504_c0_g1~~TRINITY_DN23504_c0_g1_i1.p1  ORF type:complete len:1079 (+),score=194.62 TRINITY_DN23504_c0_g1_i1:155-3391(+)
MNENGFSLRLLYHTGGKRDSLTNELSPGRESGSLYPKHKQQTGRLTERLESSKGTVPSVSDDFDSIGSDLFMEMPNHPLDADASHTPFHLKQHGHEFQDLCNTSTSLSAGLPVDVSQQGAVQDVGDFEGFADEAGDFLGWPVDAHFDMSMSQSHAQLECHAHHALAAEGAPHESAAHGMDQTDMHADAVVAAAANGGVEEGGSGEGGGPTPGPSLVHGCQASGVANISTNAPGQSTWTPATTSPMNIGEAPLEVRPVDSAVNVTRLHLLPTSSGLGVGKASETGSLSHFPAFNLASMSHENLIYSQRLASGGPLSAQSSAGHASFIDDVQQTQVQVSEGGGASMTPSSRHRGFGSYVLPLWNARGEAHRNVSLGHSDIGQREGETLPASGRGTARDLLPLKTATSHAKGSPLALSGSQKPAGSKLGLEKVQAPAAVSSGGGGLARTASGKGASVGNAGQVNLQAACREAFPGRSVPRTEQRQAFGSAVDYPSILKERGTQQTHVGSSMTVSGQTQVLGAAHGPTKSSPDAVDTSERDRAIGEGDRRDRSVKKKAKREREHEERSADGAAECHPADAVKEEGRRKGVENAGDDADKPGENPVVKKAKATEIHNQSEKARRDRINQNIKEIGESVQSPKDEKACILEDGLEYIALTKIALYKQGQLLSERGLPSIPHDIGIEGLRNLIAGATVSFPGPSVPLGGQGFLAGTPAALQMDPHALLQGGITLPSVTASSLEAVLPQRSFSLPQQRICFSNMGFPSPVGLGIPQAYNLPFQMPLGHGIDAVLSGPGGCSSETSGHTTSHQQLRQRQELLQMQQHQVFARRQRVLEQQQQQQAIHSHPPHLAPGVPVRQQHWPMVSQLYRGPIVRSLGTAAVGAIAPCSQAQATNTVPPTPLPQHQRMSRQLSHQLSSASNYAHAQCSQAGACSDIEGAQLSRLVNEPCSSTPLGASMSLNVDTSVPSLSQQLDASQHQQTMSVNVTLHQHRQQHQPSQQQQQISTDADQLSNDSLMRQQQLQQQAALRVQQQQRQQRQPQGKQCPSVALYEQMLPQSDWPEAQSRRALSMGSGRTDSWNGADVM